MQTSASQSRAPDTAGLATYNAYCIAPFFTSWLGNSTSRFGLPVTLSGLPNTSCLEVSALAGLAADDEIAAIDLYGTMAEVGLAVTTPLAEVAQVVVAGGRRGAYHEEPMPPLTCWTITCLI